MTLPGKPASAIKASETGPKTLLTVRPSFVHPLWLLRAIIGTTFGAIFLCIPIILVLAGTKILDTKEVPRIAFAAIYAGAWIVIFITSYFLTRATYKKTVYRFYDDRVEYSESFMATEDKTIRYDRMTEVTLTRGLLQQNFGLGTIQLSIPSVEIQTKQQTAGICMKDIPDSRTVYEAVKLLVKK
jgi:uncharacterized membrane protein YdbT with pleckstrin-like domain